MRIALLIVATLALAACGKKKSPQAPASPANQQGNETEQQLDDDATERDQATPDDPDDAPARSSDPQEGGE